MGAAQIREALHLFIEQADERMLNIMYYGIMKADVGQDDALEASIDRALAQSRNRDVRPHDQVMSELRAKLKS